MWDILLDCELRRRELERGAIQNRLAREAAAGQGAAVSLSGVLGSLLLALGRWLMEANGTDKASLSDAGWLAVVHELSR